MVSVSNNQKQAGKWWHKGGHTLTRTRHRTQSVKDHNVIRAGRELSSRYSTILFHFCECALVSPEMGTCDGSKEKHCVCVARYTSPFPSSIMSMCPDIVSWCINKSLQSTISIYYSGRKYLKPLCEHDWFGTYARSGIHSHTPHTTPPPFLHHAAFSPCRMISAFDTHTHARIYCTW